MYPIMLNVKNRLCVIVGGGGAARIKAAALEKEGAAVKIISPELNADFSELNIEYAAKSYEKSDLNGAFIAISATDDEELNRQITSDAAKLGILALNASDQTDSDFIPMAYSRSGDVTIAASTNGAFPLLAKKIRSEIDVKEYDKICRILKKARSVILSKNTDKDTKHALLNSLITDEMLALAKKDISAFEKTARKIAEGRI